MYQGTKIDNTMKNSSQWRRNTWKKEQNLPHFFLYKVLAIRTREEEGRVTLWTKWTRHCYCSSSSEGVALSEEWRRQTICGLRPWAGGSDWPEWRAPGASSGRVHSSLFSGFETEFGNFRGISVIFGKTTENWNARRRKKRKFEEDHSHLVLYF